MTQPRKTLPPIPEHMKHLPIDERGYPIPFFVAYINGKPDFRVMDPIKVDRAVRDSLCNVCGGKLDRFKSFVIGPMAALQRISGEPPSHRECAVFSAMACPFLVLPKSKRRESGLPENVTPVGDKADINVMDNPGITAVWTCTKFKISAEGGNFHYLDVTSLEWFTQGRNATHEEIANALTAAKDRIERIHEMANTLRRTS